MRQDPVSGLSFLAIPEGRTFDAEAETWKFLQSERGLYDLYYRLYPLSGWYNRVVRLLSELGYIVKGYEIFLPNGELFRPWSTDKRAGGGA